MVPVYGLIGSIEPQGTGAMAEGSRAAGTAEIAFVGDLMLARKVSDALVAGHTPTAFWGNVGPRLLAADAVIGNLECALTTRRERHKLKAYHFRADPRAADILTAGNIRCVALANNHVLDAGPGGLSDTLRILDRAGIKHAGAGENLAAALEPTIFRAGDMTIGVASITNTLRAFRALPERPGTAFLRIRADARTARLLRSLVASMTARSADLTVLSVHWGPNFRPWPPRRYRAFARQAIDAGFNIIHGHSAHVLQAVESYRGGLILYDTGNFLDDYWVMPGFRMDRSFLFVVTVKRGSRPRLRLFPVSVGRGVVNHADAYESDSIRRGMMHRCSGYAVDFATDGDMLCALPQGNHDTTVGPAERSIASASKTA
jgi:poly-gamma-glutamate capsule biosynthesis protein CapA/YwtB (metallophosphatase superfamily)